MQYRGMPLQGNCDYLSNRGSAMGPLLLLDFGWAAESSLAHGRPGGLR